MRNSTRCALGASRLVYRLVVRLTIVWLALAVAWVALPWKARSDDGVSYPTQELLAGRTLTRMYPSDSMLMSGRDRPTRRELFSLEVSLDLTPTSAHLVFPSYPTTPVSWPLSYWLPSTKLAPGLHRVSLMHNASDPANPEWKGEDARDRIVTYPSRTGDLDGINLPWFPRADAALLYWWMQTDFADIQVAVMFNETEADGREYVEVWPAGRMEIKDPRPLLTLTLQPNPDGPPTVLSASTPPSPISSSPSATYKLRVAVLAALVPLSVLFMAVFYAFQFFFGSLFPLLFQLFVTLVTIGVVGLLALGWWRGETGMQVIERVTELVKELLQRPERGSAAGADAAPGVVLEERLVDVEEAVQVDRDEVQSLV